MASRGESGSVRAACPSDTHVRLDEVGAAMLVLDRGGCIEDLTATARVLLASFDLPSGPGETLPATLVHALDATSLGEPITWRPRGEPGPVAGFTRYRLGEARFLLLMREITERQRAMSQRLHQQRLQEMGKLVAHIAHDLRAPLASIVYNADVLGKRDLGSASELVSEIALAAGNLKHAIAGLLDYVRLGPPVRTTMTLREICDRVSSLLRPMFRAGQHELVIALHADEVRVRSNPIAIEQVLVNLVVNAIEAATHSARIEISSEPAPRPRMWRAQDGVLMRVRDDGPGIPRERRAIVFEAFATTKPDGTGLGLTLAREAVVSLGGQLWLEDTDRGCSFAMVLPTIRVEEGA